MTCAHSSARRTKVSKRPTIDDVAREAGVARATVSRVLNASPQASERVREQVMGAVRKLDYQVNHQARQLASGASRQLGLVFAANAEAEPNSYYHSAIELGAMRVCTERGYGLVTHVFDPASADVRGRIGQLLESQRCDGLMLTPPFSDDVELIGSLNDSGNPFVLISAGPVGRGLAISVGIDDWQAGYELGKFATDNGHRRFAFITGPREHQSAALRLEGFEAALAEKGHGRESLAVAEGNFTFKSGVEVAEELLTAQPAPTVLVCANDDMAAGALFTAHRLDLSVPGDLSLTGFDDTPVSQIVWPPLTTIHQPLRQMGSKATELLIAKITPDVEPAKGAAQGYLAPFHLIERASTQPF